MLDLSEEPMEENIEICVEYLERMSKMDMILEMELGITGGEEDGVNNEDANPEDLYTKPDEVYQVYKELSSVPNGKFTAATPRATYSWIRRSLETPRSTSASKSAPLRAPSQSSSFSTEARDPTSKTFIRPLTTV